MLQNTDGTGTQTGDAPNDSGDQITVSADFEKSTDLYECID